MRAILALLMVAAFVLAGGKLFGPDDLSTSLSAERPALAQPLETELTAYVPFLSDPAADPAVVTLDTPDLAISKPGSEDVTTEAQTSVVAREPADLAEPAEESRPDAITDAAADNPCDRPPAPPLPLPDSPEAGSFWQTFRTPLPPSPVWDPPGQKRVGLQAGHWQVEQVPEELSRLGHGTSGGGRAEWEVNLDIARRTADLLEQAGIAADILPATIPPRYRAHAFVSIHADGDESGTLSGFKLARPGFSATPDADDRLIASIYESYEDATALPRDDLHISRRMTAYYAFNSRRYCHAVAPGVPSAILEMGFLTSAVDRQLLIGKPDRAAEGIAKGLLRYFNTAG